MDINKKSVEQETLTTNSTIRKYITSVDINIGESTPDEVSITIIDGDTIEIKSPIHFEIGADRLVSLYNDLVYLGIPGRLIVKALVDAINEIDSKEKLIACTNATPMNPITYFKEWCTNRLEAKRIERRISRKNAWNIMFKFKGYKGLKEIFSQGLRETISEIKRIKYLEENL